MNVEHKQMIIKYGLIGLAGVIAVALVVRAVIPSGGGTPAANLRVGELAMLRSRTFGMQPGPLASFWVATLAGTAWAAPPTCTNAATGFTEDYSYVVGSADYDDPIYSSRTHHLFQYTAPDASCSFLPRGAPPFISCSGLRRWFLIRSSDTSTARNNPAMNSNTSQEVSVCTD